MKLSCFIVPIVYCKQRTNNDIHCPVHLHSHDQANAVPKGPLEKTAEQGIGLCKIMAKLGWLKQETNGRLKIMKVERFVKVNAKMKSIIVSRTRRSNGGGSNIIIIIIGTIGRPPPSMIVLVKPSSVSRTQGSTGW